MAQKSILLSIAKYQRLLNPKIPDEGSPRSPPLKVKTDAKFISSHSGVQQQQQQHPDIQDIQPLSDEMILISLPQQHRKKVIGLLSFIKSSPSQIIQWNEKGEIIYKGQVVEKSNIIDLLRDTMRTYKGFNPVGNKQFYNALAEINVPLGNIANANQRTRLFQLKSNGHETITPAEVTSSANKKTEVHKDDSAVTKSTKRKSNTKLVGKKKTTKWITFK